MIKDKDEWGNIELPGFGDDKLLGPNINRIIAAKETVKRESWKKNNHEAITKPAVRKSKSKKLKKIWKQNQSERCGNIATSVINLWENNDYIKNQKQGRAKRYANPELCGNYKGPVVGTCKKTGQKIVLIGIKQIKEAKNGTI